ncbi:MAG TPA: SGNH/GDSL hydrolase family protein [Rhizomicrobium sp.]
MRRFGLALAVLWALTGAMAAAPAAHWVGSWATPQQIPEPRNLLPAEALTDATLRQTVRLSLGGKTLRVHITNVFGTAPLHIRSAHIARPSLILGGIDPQTDPALTFSGQGGVTIPAGADYISDPIAFDAPPLSDLTISLSYDAAPAQQTGHPGSRATSFYAPGDHVAASELPNAQSIEHWYQIEGIDVLAPASAAAVAVLGDSITDGHGATTDGNDRWTDALARRLAAARLNIAVLNKGIGGGKVLLDGLGPNALARFDRDVLAPAGVKWLIVLEGINDLSSPTREAPISPQAHAALVAGLISGYEQIVTRAHAHGIKVYGATILPSMGGTYYHPDAANEADRQAVNAWIRAPGHFDAVIDLDAATRDTTNPAWLLPLYDSGDHLHPGPKGFQAMADAVPLTFFTGPKPRKGKRK